MRLSTDKEFASANAIADALRWEIANGALPPNTKLPIRQDMCREYNAALSTMQRAIDTLVAEGFIVCTPGKGTFVHSQPPSKADVALVFGSAISARSLFCEAIRSVSGAISQSHSYRLRTFDVHGDQRERSIETLVALAASHRLAGIIVVSPSSDILDALPKPTTGSVPMVLIGREGRNYPHFPRIEVDQSSFASSAISYLQRNGRRRIAHILADGIFAYLDDTAEKLRELNCENTPYWVQFVGEGRRWRGAEHIAHLLMRLPPAERPNGLIIHDDNLIQWATVGLRASGVLIPKDIEVVVHTNFPCPAISAVPVTKFGFDAHAVLEAAMAHLGAPLDPTRPATVIPAQWQA